MTTNRRLLTVRDQIHSREEVRKRVVDAASKLYARQGFRNTSMEQIAEAAGVTLPIVYSYVKTKSMIMELIMEALLEDFEKNLDAKMGEAEDPLEKLSRAFALFCSLVTEQKEKVLLLYWHSHILDGEARQRVKDHEVTVSRYFVKIIEEGMKKGSLKPMDADLAAYNLVMLAYMWILKGWHFRDRMTLDQFIEAETEFIMQAMKP